MNIILVILGILITFFIPGYILTTLFLKNIRFKVPVSIGLSICILTLVGFILGLFGFLKAGYLWGVLLVLISIPLIYYRKTFLDEIKKFNVRRVFNKKNLLLLLILIVVFFAIYFVRFGPSQLYLEQTIHSSKSFFIPIHADEWTHLAQVKYSMNSGENTFVNPYMKSLPPHNNFEVGFHTFTASFFLLTGLDAVKNYHVFAAVFAMIAALLIYSFLFLLTKQRIVGIFGMLFFLSLPSNTNLLGTWFYVPMSMSIFLIFLFLTLLYQSKRHFDFYILGFILIASLLIYPFAAILLGIIGLFYVLQDRDMLKLRIKPIHRILIAALVILALITIILLTDFKTILSLLIFKKGWRFIENIYSPFSLVGIFWLLLSLFGIFIMFIKKYEKSIVYALAILSLNILAFYIFEKSLLFMYRINFYYFLLLMGIFGAVGSGYIFKQTSRIFRKGQIKIIVQGVIIILLLLILFSNYYKIEDDGSRLHRFIDLEEFYMLEEIGQRYTGETIMADILISQAIYPITDNHVVSILSSNLGGGDSRGVYYFFYRATCEEKEMLFEWYNLELVIAKEQINCDFLTEEKKNGFYLYI